MDGHALNIVGGEWVIIAFVALVMVLGTGRLPEAARKLGRAAGEFGRARDAARAAPGGPGVRVTGPARDERQKLESIARSLGEDPAGMTEAELRGAIARRLGEGPAGG